MKQEPITLFPIIDPGIGENVRSIPQIIAIVLGIAFVLALGMSFIP
jgi:hypothetical protein